MPIFTVSRGFLPLVTAFNNKIVARSTIPFRELIALHSTKKKSLIFDNMKDAQTILVAMLQSCDEEAGSKTAEQGICIFASPVIFGFQTNALNNTPTKQLTVEIIKKYVVSKDFNINEHKLQAAQELSNNFAIPYFRSKVIRALPEVAWHYNPNLTLQELELRGTRARPT